MPRIYESRCGDAYCMFERMLDIPGTRSERAMNAWLLCGNGLYFRVLARYIMAC